MKLNKKAYTELIEQDMKAVRRSSTIPTLEADHICLVLCKSIELLYPQSQEPSKGLLAEIERETSNYNGSLAQRCAKIAQTYIEAAREESAVAFANWLDSNGWRLWDHNCWVKAGIDKHYTTNELYVLYKESLNTK